MATHTLPGVGRAALINPVLSRYFRVSHGGPKPAAFSMSRQEPDDEEEAESPVHGRQEPDDEEEMESPIHREEAFLEQILIVPEERFQKKIKAWSLHCQSVYKLLS